MLLRDYLKLNSLNQCAFGKQAGISQSMLSKYIRLQTVPSAESLFKIQQATNGEVTVADFLNSDSSDNPTTMVKW